MWHGVPAWFAVMNKETVCVVMMICFESFNPYQSDDDDDDDDDASDCQQRTK